MNLDNRSRQMQPCARVGRRKATASRYFATRYLPTEGFSFGGNPNRTNLGVDRLTHEKI